MTFQERKQNMENLLEQIKLDRCGSLKCIAENFDCSESTVKQMITFLREDGHNIYYCRVARKFLIKE